MLTLSFAARSPLVILCLGAHSDDIEIGCAGTLLHLRKSMPQVRFHWAVMSAAGKRRDEAEKAANMIAGDCEKNIELNSFRDGFLPYDGAIVKEYFENLKSRVKPDLIFTHWQSDAHQDHRLVSELTWNTFRNHLILEYEIPKYDGDMGRPACYVPLDHSLVDEKTDCLMQAFATQNSRPWFDGETFRGLMRLRGMECNAASGFAEAFYTRKFIVNPAL